MGRGYEIVKNQGRVVDSMVDLQPETKLNIFSEVFIGKEDNDAR